jgi:hypothetical protein
MAKAVYEIKDVLLPVTYIVCIHIGVEGSQNLDQYFGIALYVRMMFLTSITYAFYATDADSTI